MTLPFPLPEDLAELIARRFRLLGDATRIRILDQLRHGEATGTQLAASVGTTQQNVSKHLGILAEAGIVVRRRQGNFSYYHVADDGIWDLCHHVCGDVERRLEEIRTLLHAPSEREVA
jgi:DNA-binding transcriptional ArsR family regulator